MFFNKVADDHVAETRTRRAQTVSQVGVPDVVRPITAVESLTMAGRALDAAAVDPAGHFVMRRGNIEPASARLRRGSEAEATPSVALAGTRGRVAYSTPRRDELTPAQKSLGDVLFGAPARALPTPILQVRAETFVKRGRAQTVDGPPAPEPLNADASNFVPSAPIPILHPERRVKPEPDFGVEPPWNAPTEAERQLGYQKCYLPNEGPARGETHELVPGSPDNRKLLLSRRVEKEIQERIVAEGLVPDPPTGELNLPSPRPGKGLHVHQRRRPITFREELLHLPPGTTTPPGSPRRLANHVAWEDPGKTRNASVGFDLPEDINRPFVWSAQLPEYDTTAILLSFFPASQSADAGTTGTGTAGTAETDSIPCELSRLCSVAPVNVSVNVVTLDAPGPDASGKHSRILAQDRPLAVERIVASLLGAITRAVFPRRDATLQLRGRSKADRQHRRQRRRLRRHPPAAPPHPIGLPPAQFPAPADVAQQGTCIVLWQQARSAAYARVFRCTATPGHALSTAPAETRPVSTNGSQAEGHAHWGDTLGVQSWSQILGSTHSGLFLGGITPATCTGVLTDIVGAAPYDDGTWLLFLTVESAGPRRARLGNVPAATWADPADCVRVMGGLRPWYGSVAVVLIEGLPDTPTRAPILPLAPRTRYRNLGRDACYRTDEHGPRKDLAAWLDEVDAEAGSSTDGSSEPSDTASDTAPSEYELQPGTRNSLADTVAGLLARARAAEAQRALGDEAREARASDTTLSRSSSLSSTISTSSTGSSLHGAEPSDDAPRTLRPQTATDVRQPYLVQAALQFLRDARGRFVLRSASAHDLATVAGLVRSDATNMVLPPGHAPDIDDTDAGRRALEGARLAHPFYGIPGLLVPAQATVHHLASVFPGTPLTDGDNDDDNTDFDTDFDKNDDNDNGRHAHAVVVSAVQHLAQRDHGDDAAGPVEGEPCAWAFFVGLHWFVRPMDLRLPPPHRLGRATPDDILCQRLDLDRAMPLTSGDTIPLRVRARPLRRAASAFVLVQADGAAIDPLHAVALRRYARACIAAHTLPSRDAFQRHWWRFAAEQLAGVPDPYTLQAMARARQMEAARSVLDGLPDDEVGRAFARDRHGHWRAAGWPLRNFLHRVHANPSGAPLVDETERCTPAVVAARVQRVLEAPGTRMATRGDLTLTVPRSAVRKIR